MTTWPAGVADVQRHTLRVLIAGQVFGGAAIGIGISVGSLLAKDILGRDTYAGLAFAAFAFGAAGAAVPLSRTMARRGRRAGLTRGYVVAACGAATAVVAAEVNGFVLLLVGMVLFGAGNASNLLARYAAADLAPPGHRARAISTVVWATTVGAVAGPNLLSPSGALADRIGVTRLAGPFVLAFFWAAAAACVVGTRLRPDPMAVAGLLDAGHGARRRPPVKAQFARILQSSDATAGLATMAVAQGVMVSVMTMTPLHLRGHGDSLAMVGLVMSVHIAGMYALAPVFGVLADRSGPMKVAYGAGATLASAAVLAAVSGNDHLLVGAALVLLGLGWSMATISGSSLLTGALAPEERADVQGVADMSMGLMGGTGGVLAGVVVAGAGYSTLGLLAAGVAVGLIVVLVTRRAPLAPVAVNVPLPAE